MSRVQLRAVTMPETMGQSVDVTFRYGESYEVAVRGHSFVVDQPVEDGGADQGPMPVELFVASLATCVAHYAGRYLARHGYSRDGLGVSATYQIGGRPARVAYVRLTVRVPEDVPAERWPALHAVVSHCTVHNSLTEPPAVQIDLSSPQRTVEGS